MKRNLILLAMIFLMVMGTHIQNAKSFFGYVGIDGKLSKLKKHYKKLEKLNEQLIFQQLITSDLNLVADLFKQNLASKKKDPKIDEIEENNDFRTRVGKILQDLDIQNKGIKKHEPIKKSSPRATYFPYQIKVRCTFEQFAELINALEKNERIILINEFRFISNVKKISKFKDNPKDIMKHDIELDVMTVTLRSTGV